MAESRRPDMAGYVEVAERIREFRESHPEGSLQQVALDFREVAGSWWVIYTAAAYRSPDDSRPGHGTAWEQVPGTTPYTRGSEVQNAETSAWGRAIVAALGADTRRGIASAEEVRAGRARERTDGPADAGWVARFQAAVDDLATERGLDADELSRSIVAEATEGRVESADTLLRSDEVTVKAVFRQRKAEPEPEHTGVASP